MIESPFLVLNGFPKLIESFALIRFSILSLNSPVLGSKKLIGNDSSFIDQIGDPSAAVVAAVPTAAQEGNRPDFLEETMFEPERANMFLGQSRFR